MQFAYASGRVGGWLCAGVGLLEKERPLRASFAQTRRKKALEEDGQMEWKKTGGQRGEAVGDEEGTRERVMVTVMAADRLEFTTGSW